MGNTCGAACQNCNGENKTEFNDNDPQPDGVRQSLTIMGTNKGQRSEIYDQQQGDLHFKMNVKKIMRIQALYRGIKARRMFEMVLLTAKVTSKYFSEEEAKETLHGFFKMSSKPFIKNYQYKNGAVYNGEWLGGFRHGRGVMKWADGAIYEGEWNYGQAYGQGKFHHVDGDIYEGQWSNNKANGFGVYINAKGARYEGHWKDDQQHGRGVEVWHEGSQYEGDYVMGKKEGFGKYTWADGSTYEGDWLDNRINGKGVYLWKDGRRYYGEWTNNDMEGMGVYYWADGRCYQGQYHNDKKCGYGLYYWTDGRKYEGWWLKGKQHGLGTYHDPKKDKTKLGLWEGGKRIRWFDDQTATLISQNTVDYTTYFTEPESANSVRPNCTFDRPKGFNDQLATIRRNLKVPAEK